MTFESQVAGIPCQVRVDDFSYTQPWRGPIESCPSADDYYGGYEIYFTILDRKGYEAPWLEKKMTDADHERIEEEIKEYYTRD